MAQRDEFAGDGSAPGDAILDGIVGDDIGVLDAVDLSIILISRDCRIAHVNRAATTVLGLNAADVGRTLSDSLPGLEDINRLCARVMADGAPHRIETRLGDKSFLLRIAPYSGKDRGVLGSVLAFTNVTAFRASIDQAIYDREYTKAILNAVVDPLVVLDDKLRVQTANRAFYSLFGVSRDETQSISIRELGNDEWATSPAWASVEASLSNHTQAQAIEVAGELPVIGRRTFVLDAHGLARDRHALILLTFHDITERKQAERTTSLLAAIVDSSDDAILSKKLDGTITSWNKSAERLFGYTPEEAIGQHITLIVPWERRSEEEGILRRLAEGERVDHFETVRSRKDGTTLEVSLTISPIRDVNGQVVGASNVARDITERKRVERALSEQARLLDLSSDAIFVRDAGDRVTYWNQAASELYGFTRQEALGRVTHELLCTQFPTALDKINEQLQRDERWSGELVHTRKDGERVTVNSRWVLDRKASGNTWCTLETNSDTTQQRRTEKALRESEERFRAQLTEEAAALTKLNELSLRLWRRQTMEEGLNEMLVAVIELLGADRGNIQILDRKRGVLGIAVQHGFQQDFLNFFREVSTKEDSACGRALRSGQRIVIEDVEQDPAYAPMRSVARAADYRSVVSAPLISADGEPRGMVSTHFRSPHRPTDQDLRRLDLYARQAADYILRCETDEALHRSEERFRAFVTASSDVVYRMNADWSEMRHLDGRGFISDTGKPRKDWLNEYIHPDDQPLMLRTIREAVRSKSMFELEHRVRRTDGTLGWTYSRAVPLFDGGDEIVEWFGAASDVTDRKEAEEKYRKLAQTLDGEVRARTRELEEQSSQVRDLSWRLLRSQDEERRHIARELHDSAGQTLTVLGINLAQLAQKAGRNAPELATDAEQIQETVQQLHREIRTTSYLLHPPLLDENGLYSAVSWYIQGLQERSGLEVHLDISKDFGRLPRDMELVIFRLVQECLTNIHRHSESKTASIRIARASDQITLEIRDQGKGMSRDRLAEIQSGLSGLGIRGMRERLSQFEGTMNIESDSSGTRVFATIPIPSAAASEDDSKLDPLQTAI